MSKDNAFVIGIMLVLVGVGGLLFIYYATPFVKLTIDYNDTNRSFSSNGERIYFTGINETGKHLKFIEGPVWLYMHGGSCVNCHGEKGRGGVPVMMGNVVPTDITYTALTQTHKVPYNDTLIKRAITKGIDSEGKTLDPTMPRWEILDNDLNDIIAYLRSLG